MTDLRFFLSNYSPMFAVGAAILALCLLTIFVTLGLSLAV